MAKRLVGTVTSVKGDKTIVITVQTRKTDPLYKKQYSTTAKFMAHDENNECLVGDRVSIIETRPLSARKRYTLRKIIERAAIREEDRAAIDEIESEKVAKQKAEAREAKKTAEIEQAEADAKKEAKS